MKSKGSGPPYWNKKLEFILFCYWNSACLIAIFPNFKRNLGGSKKKKISVKTLFSICDSVGSCHCASVRWFALTTFHNEILWLTGLCVWLSPGGLGNGSCPGPFCAPCHMFINFSSSETQITCSNNAEGNIETHPIINKWQNNLSINLNDWQYLQRLDFFLLHFLGIYFQIFPQHPSAWYFNAHITTWPNFRSHFYLSQLKIYRQNLFMFINKQPLSRRCP